MPKILKIFLIATGVLVALIVCTAVLAVLFFPGEKIRSLAEKELSNALDMPVAIGGIGLSFAGIPSLKVTDFSIGAVGDSESPLFRVKSVKVRVALLKLLSQKLEIVSVEIIDPEVTLITREDGTQNLPQNNDAPDQDVQPAGPPPIPIPITLQSLTVKNGCATIDNRDSDVLITFDDISARFSLNVDSALNTFTSSGKTKIGSISLQSAGEGEPIEGIKAAFSHSLNGDLATGKIVLSDGLLTVNGLNIDMSATVTEWANAEFDVSTGDMEIGAILDAVPDGIIPEKENITASGSVSISAGGTYIGTTREPSLTYSGEVNVDVAPLSYKGLPKSVDEISARITFTEEEITIGNSAVRIGTSNVTLSGLVKNYTEDPAVTLNADGDIDLADAADALPLPEGTDISGKVSFHIAMGGDATAPESFRADGDVQMVRVTAVVPETLKNPAEINAEISLNPSEITITNASLKSGVTDISFTGKLTNYMTLAGLVEGSARLTGIVSSDMIDLNDLLVKAEPEEEAEAEPLDLESTLMSLPIPPNVSAEIGVRLGTVKTGKLAAESVRSRITLGGGEFAMKDIAVKAYSGTLTGETALHYGDPEDIRYDGSFSLKELEAASFIAGLFDVEDVFRGKLSSTLSFSGSGLDSLSLTRNLKAKGKLSFLNGELNNWDFAKKMGKYLKFLNFDTVKFDSISNSFSVEEGKFHTPDMAINSEFGRFTASGFTGFDKSVDYSVTMFLDDTSSQAAVKQLSSLSKLIGGENTGPLEFNVTVSGSLDSPTFSLDTSAAEQQLRDTVKSTLKNEAEKLLDSQTGDIKEKGKELLNRLFR